VFLALTTEMRPRHCFQPSLRDRLLADFTHTVGTLFDPSQRLFDCPRQTPISSVQTNLKLGLGIGVGLVNHISPQAPCRWHPGKRLTQGRRQLTLFLQQQSVVSLQVVWAHDPPSLGGNLAYDSAFYTRTNPVGLKKPSFAKVAEAMGMFGARVERPEQLEPALQAAFSDNGPAVIEVLTRRLELAMPPTITLEEAKGFSLYMLRTVMNGRGNELIDLAKTNLFH
jgi:Thiamine pyrophosphate enzyme, C-terminal TPP binding domain